MSNRKHQYIKKSQNQRQLNRIKKALQLKLLMKYKVKNQSQQHHLLPQRNRVTAVINSKASSASLPPNLSRRSQKKNRQQFRRPKRRHRSQRKVCLLDSKSRFTKMRQTVRRLKKLYRNINMRWIFQIKAYWIEKRKGWYKSKMMSMLLTPMLQPQQMFDEWRTEYIFNKHISNYLTSLTNTDIRAIEILVQYQLKYLQE